MDQLAQQEDRDAPPGALRASSEEATDRTAVEERWIVDSGATHHMTSSMSFMHHGVSTPTRITVRVADGEGVEALRSGHISVTLRGSDQKCGLPLRDVLLVPRLDANLLSAHQLARQGYLTLITQSGTYLLTPTGRVLAAHIDLHTGAAFFLIRPAKEEEGSVHARVATAKGGSGGCTAQHDPRAELWHRRTGHSGWAKLRKWVELGLLVGRTAPTVESLKRHLKTGRACDVCATANQKEAPYPDRPPSRADTALALVHCDLMGPFLGHPSFNYVLTVVDDHTRKTWVYCLADRTAETLTQTLDAWAQQVEVALGQPVVVIHSDNGKEFVADELQDWAKQRGTAWSWTAPYSSAQNGIAERRNGLLEERMRAMLRGARLPQGFWPYAVQYAAYVLNRTPSITLSGNIPQQLWTGKAPDLTALRTFGCLCWTLIYPEQRSEGKLSARGLRGIFLGIGEERKAWLVFCPSSSSNSLRWSRSVVFDETRTYDHSIALEEPKPVVPRQDDHVEMQLKPPKDRQRGKRRNPTADPSSTVPEGVPTDEDLRMQEYELADDVQVLEPPSSGLPSPVADEEVDMMEDAALREGLDEEGVLPMWAPSSSLGSPEYEPSIDIDTRVRQFQQEWESDSSTPSAIMSLDDLSELLEQQPVATIPRASTPPAPEPRRPPRSARTPVPTEQLRRSARIRGRMAHGLSEDFSRAEEEQAARATAEEYARTRSAVAVLGLALHWASTAVAHGTSADGVPLEPQNLRQAKLRPASEWAQWRQAMDEEISSLAEMGTWTLVDPPYGRTIVGSRWVFKLKLDRDGRVARYKARLVAQGFTQREGVDFKETFAPVARLGTVRLVIALALALGLDLGSIDIKTAYLNGILYEEVYMAQPPEYDDGSGRVCLLRRAIYGLRQAGRAWFDTLKARLQSAGFLQVQSEPCLFIRNRPSGIVILAVYVDDIVIAARGEAQVAAVKAEFSSWYKMTDNGDLSYILGIKVDYDRTHRTVSLSQTAYIESLLRKYGLDQEQPLSSPITEASRRLGPNTAGQASRSDVHDYAALVGSLLWVAQGTRPDVSFAVGHLARFMSNPAPAHFLAAKRILRYLGGTRNQALCFSGTGRTSIAGWSDSDHATDPTTRRSVSGYIFQVFGNTVSWRSRLQDTVAISSTEAEYVALSEAAREAKWLRSVMRELGVNLISPATILTDSKGAQAIARDPADHPRTKHIETHHHLVRQLQERKEVLVDRVDTELNPADMLTKAVNAARITLLGSIIRLVEPGSVTEKDKAKE